MSPEPPAIPAAAGQRLPREARVRRKQDFQRCYRRGRRRRGAHVIVYFAPNQQTLPRVGLTVSRKVGKAVVRQRVKRRLREIFRRFPKRRELAGLDVVLHALPSAGAAGFAELAADVERLLAGLARTPR